MKIIRNGQEFELTEEELFAAHTECVVSFFRGEMETSFDIPTSHSLELAKKAYDMYAEGDGKTEYECIECTVDEFRKQIKEMLIEKAPEYKVETSAITDTEVKAVLYMCDPESYGSESLEKAIDLILWTSGDDDLDDDDDGDDDR